MDCLRDKLRIQHEIEKYEVEKWKNLIEKIFVEVFNENLNGKSDKEIK